MVQPTSDATGDGRGRDEDFSSPPVQIPACAANAPGSSLGFWRRSGDRVAVYRSDWRKEAGDELDEPLPAEACRLAAPLDPLSALAALTNRLALDRSSAHQPPENLSRARSRCRCGTQRGTSNRNRSDRFIKQSRCFFARRSDQPGASIWLCDGGRRQRRHRIL
jgi:hypothetical protein